MKNFVKEGQKLPLFGVGPYIVYGMAAATVVVIVIFCYVLKIGNLEKTWTLVFRIAGGVLCALGIFIWLMGAVFSHMDKNISENKLQTKGIYSCVRNPMYSGWWILITGISMMRGNTFVLVSVPLNWLIMTISLKNTEEKWLLDLYGEEYAEYKKRVNRCIPWFPRKNLELGKE